MLRSAVFLIALLALPVQATAPAQAIVVLDSDAGEIHSGINVSGAYSVALDSSFRMVNPAYGQMSSGSFGGDLAAGAIGGLIAGAIIASAQQKAADAVIAPLTSLATEKERAASIRAGIRAALAAQGFAEVSFIATDSPSAKLLPRITVGNDTALVLFIASDAKEGFANSLVTMTPDNRSLRVAARLEWVTRESNGFSKVTTRRVNLFSRPSSAEQPVAALSEWLAAGGPALQLQLEAAASRVLELALQPGAPVEASKADSVAFVNPAGAFEVGGKLLKQDGSQIVVADKNGNLAVFSADVLLPN